MGDDGKHLEGEGKPDWEKAASKYKEQRDQFKADLDKLTAQLSDLQNKVKDALTQDDVDAAVTKALDDSKAETQKLEEGYKAREKRLVIENSLIKAGCSDTVATLAHVDLDKVEVAQDGHVSGLDTKQLKTDLPYLFHTESSIRSAASPSGVGKKITKEEILAIKDGKERRQKIYENEDLFE